MTLSFRIIILFFFLTTLISCTSKDKTQAEVLYSFPKDFIWGTATSAYQIEGGITTCDWYDWERMSGTTRAGELAITASDHYHLYKRDIELMADLGVNAYRFSIEWSRIQPKPDVFDANEIEHYRDVLKELKKYHIIPIVTLNHFTLPKWIHDIHDNSEYGNGGWIGTRSSTIGEAYIVQKFEKYSARMAQEYGDMVDYWITFNEPIVEITAAYLIGVFPPGEFGAVDHLIKAFINTIFAHARAYKAIKQYDTIDSDNDGENSKITIAHHWALYTPENPDDSKDVEAAKQLDYLYNYLLFNALIHGKIDLDLNQQYTSTTTALNETITYQTLKGTLDLIGINYYSESVVKAKPITLGNYTIKGTPSLEAREEYPRSDMGYRIYPEGIYIALSAVSKFGLPILITENGIADKYDINRAKFIIDHLQQVHLALKDNIPVIGYLYWSLIDNFEWGLGYGPRFGLFSVDYDTQKRIKTEGVQVFQNIVKHNGILSSDYKTYADIPYQSVHCNECKL